ncbi:hypothetical protein B0H39_002496 [Clostridium beijerinckii]|uniref:hypothetical protein n=1 Tax=Clostridium beijerinckii TaxID=1520 RepID=UPI001494B19F|nr:hypothetical protein [Clostridium beijerinckii]NOW84615.1 hypothetical protein [Clostridium beijerinckii]
MSMSYDSEELDIIEELFPCTLEHNPFDLKVYRGFGELTLILDDDKLKEIEEYFGEEEYMDLSFKSSDLIWLYFVCEDISKVKKDSSLIKYLFESKEAAMFNGIKGTNMDNKVIGRCTLDMGSCLDLLNPKDIVNLYKIYNKGLVESKALKDKDMDYILTYYMSLTEYKSVRNTLDIQINIPKQNLNIVRQCIAYKVYKKSCIDNIELVKDYSQANK